MATFAAVKSANEKGLQHSGRSSDLDSQTAAPALDCAKDPAFYTAAPSGSGVVSVASWAVDATKHGMFDAALFERIIVSPRSKALGFVLSTVTFPVEVWNTFQASAKTLNTISISGGGGVTVSGGLGSAATFGPGQASTYTVSVAQVGPASLANIVTFNFAGGITGADLALSGSRITVFSAEIDWSDGFDETAAWKTQIMSAYSDMEQRVQLRSVPRYGAEFRVLTTTPLETTGLTAMVYAWQARMFGVPWWPDASPLVVGVTPGANTLQVDTTLRPSFEAGGLVMLWTDIFTWEALTILSVTGSSVALQSPVQGTWAAGVQVVPLRRGRLRNRVPIDRPSSLTALLKVSFDCEVA